MAGSKFLPANRLAGADETVNGKRVRCYHDPKAGDPYTVIYMDTIEQETPSGKLYGARGMDERPSHPQGIGMYTSAMPGKHLGRRIPFADLPADCRRIVEQDTAE